MAKATYVNAEDLVRRIHSIGVSDYTSNGYSNLDREIDARISRAIDAALLTFKTHLAIAIEESATESPCMLCRQRDDEWQKEPTPPTA